MNSTSYTYIIIGGGIAGVSAIKGIRELDTRGSILLMNRESSLPYTKPLLTKGLLMGKKRIDEIYIQKQAFYDQQNVTVAYNLAAVSIDPHAKTVTASNGKQYAYSKLLLATGGTPRKLDALAPYSRHVHYFRSLDDYNSLIEAIAPAKRVLVIGGGFIGTEIAAALSQKQVVVTMLFPEAWPCAAIFPEVCGTFMIKLFREHQITILSQDQGIRYERKGSAILTHTKNAATIESDVIVVGIGTVPVVELAKSADLALERGIRTDQYLRTSNDAIYAAGDNTAFFNPSTHSYKLVEHWQNAAKQGRIAGKNMAGGNESYQHQSFFATELFDVSLKVIGEAGASMTTRIDWHEEYKRGVIYYLCGEQLSGIMLWNFSDQVDTARFLLEEKSGVPFDITVARSVFKHP
ncbi:MAG: NAD(P)/FAD-dependent oxidoreductase [Chitinivibrionales bacterium]|nr:NAD(P)/FAD-dependent oxidoreductase [Chitinivibrionales bacterium]